MTFSKKIIPVYLFLLIGVTFAKAQIKFKLIQLDDRKTYQVSLISEASYAPPFNLTSTAQVTLKVPTDGLDIIHLVNLQEEVIWEPNSKSAAPEESPGFDYISFGLISQGTDKLHYQAGVELPLFAFQNAIECSGEISLIDNLNDPFAPPNSRQVNVGNQITIYGAKGDAYIGNMEESVVPCSNLTALKELNQSNVQLTIFPNPIVEELNLSINWNRKQEWILLSIMDISGKIVFIKNIELSKGLNQERIATSPLGQGSYFIELRGADWRISSKKFVKVNP